MGIGRVEEIAMAHLTDLGPSLRRGGGMQGLLRGALGVSKCLGLQWHKRWLLPRFAEVFATRGL